MKNKRLSYLLGGFLTILPLVIIGNIYADCDCPEEDTGCRMVCHYESEEYGEYINEIDGGELDEVVITPEEETCPNGCCGIKLNTNFPIIGNCIETKKGGATDPTNAFPRMIGVLTKIIMSLILVVCFILVIYAGILWSANKPKESKDILKKVAITVLLLGFSGVILRLINPNFFG